MSVCYVLPTVLLEHCIGFLTLHGNLTCRSVCSALNIAARGRGAIPYRARPSWRQSGDLCSVVRVLNGMRLAHMSVSLAPGEDVHILTDAVRSHLRHLDVDVMSFGRVSQTLGVTFPHHLTRLSLRTNFAGTSRLGDPYDCLSALTALRRLTIGNVDCTLSSLRYDIAKAVRPLTTLESLQSSPARR